MPKRTEEVARFRRWWFTQDIPSSRWESPSGHSCRTFGFPRRYTTPAPREMQHCGSSEHHQAAHLLCSPIVCVLLPQPPTTHSPRSVVPRTRPRPELGTRGVGSVRGAHLGRTTSTAGHLNTPAYVSKFPPDWDSQLRPFTRNLLCFPNLPGAVSTLLQTARPTQCVPGQAQDSCRAPVTVNVLTPTLNRVRRSRHLHIRWFRSPAPALVVPCSPMPVVTSVNQVVTYQVCSHPASVCLHL